MLTNVITQRRHILDESEQVCRWKLVDIDYMLHKLEVEEIKKLCEKD